MAKFQFPPDFSFYAREGKFIIFSTTVSVKHITAIFLISCYTSSHKMYEGMAHGTMLLKAMVPDVVNRAFSETGRALCGTFAFVKE
jgi:hypothetical protein